MSDPTPQIIGMFQALLCLTFGCWGGRPAPLDMSAARYKLQTDDDGAQHPVTGADGHGSFHGCFRRQLSAGADLRA